MIFVKSSKMALGIEVQIIEPLVRLVT